MLLNFKNNNKQTKNSGKQCRHNMLDFKLICLVCQHLAHNVYVILFYDIKAKHII